MRRRSLASILHLQGRIGRALTGLYHESSVRCTQHECAQLRATGESTIEKLPEGLWEQELLAALDCEAERVGFEPTVRNLPHTGFRNRLLQPLGHLSK